MKIISIPPSTTPTYDFFRRQVRRLIAETSVENPSEAHLRAVVAAAVEDWRARGFAKSWIARARVEALREIASTTPDARPAPHLPAAEQPVA